MSGDVIPFRRPVTGAALLIQRRRRETDEALRQFVEANRFFREVWAKEFEAEFPEFANREFQLTAGLV